MINRFLPKVNTTCKTHPEWPRYPATPLHRCRRTARTVFRAGCFLLIGVIFTAELRAQESPAPPPMIATDSPAETEDARVIQPGFKNIVFGGGVVNGLIWFMLFLASFATITFVIDGMTITKRRRLLPETVISGVRDALGQGDLDRAIAICEDQPGPLSRILNAGFLAISSGYDAIQEAVSIAADLESEKILQRISYLNLCGQISPMLGLLGTVVGMVKAFAGLAGEAGAAKAQLLALAISGALWTTVAGLLISVPALLAYFIFKNIATKILLESQATVLDLLKILRNAQLEEE